MMRNLIEFLMNSRPGLIGAGIGLTLALSLVIFGFFKTLFILLLTFAGYIFLLACSGKGRETWEDGKPENPHSSSCTSWKSSGTSRIGR
jgi:uncharacterized membrane protein